MCLLSNGLEGMEHTARNSCLDVREVNDQASLPTNNQVCADTLGGTTRIMTKCIFVFVAFKRTLLSNLEYIDLSILTSKSQENY
jgi:hypothetical protein